MLNSKTAITILFFFFAAFSVLKAQKLSIEVISNQKGESIAYAHVVNQSLKKGTITDINGKAIVQYGSLQDTIQISFIGFATQTLTVQTIKNNPKIVLVQRPEKLGEIEVIAENTLLYKLVRACKKNAPTHQQEGKVYFELASYLNQQQVEQLENYYMGTMVGADVQSLDLYKGRVGIDRVDNKSFLSLETSRAFYMHKTFEQSDYFPDSPLTLSYRKMRKHFDLSLIRRYTDENNHRIYNIQFEPKDDFGGFEGTLYIDSTLQTLLKVELKTTSSKKHPFLPLHKSDTIVSIDIELNKTFLPHSATSKSSLQSIDFNYSIRYQNRAKEIYTINTEAVLYAYDYNSQFPLPIFNTGDRYLNDYRRISILPYDTLFWNHHQEFRLENRKKNIDTFIENAFLANEELFKSSGKMKFRRGMFEHPYKRWSPTRITFAVTDTVEQDALKPQFKADLYNLSAKLLINPTELGDSIRYQSYAVFDPMESYYKLPLDTAGMIFINLYFDLVEVQNRQLQKDLAATKSYEEALNLFHHYEEKTEIITSFFLQQVRRGKNLSVLERYTSKILSELGVNNFAYFNFRPEYD